MAKNALKSVDNAVARNVQHVRVAREAKSNLPAVVAPKATVVTINPDGTPTWSMPLERARELVDSCFARTDDIDAQIKKLNDEKSSVSKILKDVGLDYKKLREARREARLDPTMRMVEASTRKIYRMLFDGAFDVGSEDVA